MWTAIFRLYVLAAAVFVAWLLTEAAHHPALHHFLFAGL